MPLHLRLKAEWQMDSAFPRDCLCINPCFRIEDLGLQDADALCEDLATALNTWDVVGTEIRVKSYDIQGTPPVFPNGSAVRNVGTISAAAVPRELAVCLSFYGGQNVPRRRGRLFVPLAVFSQSTAGRPTLATRQKVADLVPILTGLGGSNVDWGVWSTTDRLFHPVTNWWVDDEWDVIRSRGMRPTARLAGTASE